MSGVEDIITPSFVFFYGEECEESGEKKESVNVFVPWLKVIFVNFWLNRLGKGIAH